MESGNVLTIVYEDERETGNPREEERSALGEFPSKSIERVVRGYVGRNFDQRRVNEVQVTVSGQSDGIQSQPVEQKRASDPAEAGVGKPADQQLRLEDVHERLPLFHRRGHRELLESVVGNGLPVNASRPLQYVQGFVEPLLGEQPPHGFGDEPEVG